MRQWYFAATIQRRVTKTILEGLEAIKEMIIVFGTERAKTSHSEARPLERTLPRGSVSWWQLQREEESRRMESLGRWPWGSTRRECTNEARDTLALRSRLQLGHL